MGTCESCVRNPGRHGRHARCHGEMLLASAQRIEGAKIAAKVRAGASGDWMLRGNPRAPFPRRPVSRPVPLRPSCLATSRPCRVSKAHNVRDAVTCLIFSTPKPRTTFWSIRNPNPGCRTRMRCPQYPREFEAKMHDPFIMRACRSEIEVKRGSVLGDGPSTNPWLPWLHRGSVISGACPPRGLERVRRRGNQRSWLTMPSRLRRARPRSGGGRLFPSVVLMSSHLILYLLCPCWVSGARAFR